MNEEQTLNGVYMTRRRLAEVEKFDSLVVILGGAFIAMCLCALWVLLT